MSVMVEKEEARFLGKKRVVGGKRAVLTIEKRAKEGECPCDCSRTVGGGKW